jgi:hypothetical protein
MKFSVSFLATVLRLCKLITLYGEEPYIVLHYLSRSSSSLLDFALQFDQTEQSWVLNPLCPDFAFPHNRNPLTAPSPSIRSNSYTLSVHS